MHRKRKFVLPAALIALGGVAALLAASSAVGRSQAAPTNTKEPSILYVYPMKVGTELSSNKGGWSGNPTKYGYQWLRCNDNGGDCKKITNATGETYTVVSADAGHTLRLEVTASNSDGKAKATANATSVVPAGPGVPNETAPPEIFGSAIVGQQLTASPGSWQGTQPINLTIHWQACTETSCSNNGYTGKKYTVAKGDVGKRVRVKVVAKNSDGQTAGLSDPTAVVVAQTSGDEIITLPNGEKSVPVTALGKEDRLIVDDVKFTPNPITSRDVPFQVRIKVIDTKNHVVRGALVYIRSTPLLSSTPTDAPTGTDGWITYNIQPRSDWPLKNGSNVQFFVKAYRQGDPTLAGVRGDRLVQVATATP